MYDNTVILELLINPLNPLIIQLYILKHII